MPNTSAQTNYRWRLPTGRYDFLLTMEWNVKTVIRGRRTPEAGGSWQFRLAVESFIFGFVFNAVWIMPI